MMRVCERGHHLSHLPPSLLLIYLPRSLLLLSQQEGYEMIATRDGTGAIIIVDFVINNGMMDIPASSVYTAGPHHALFSMSLSNVYRDAFGFSTDFAPIEALPVSSWERRREVMMRGRDPMEW